MMLDLLLGLRLNPLLLGLTVLIAGVVAGFGARSDSEDETSPAQFLNVVAPEYIPPEDVQICRDLEYARPNGQPLCLDLYRPRDIAGPLPVVVWIHGGGWRSGSKASPAAAELVPQGYAVASIDYRLSDQALFPAQLEDCQAAVRWLRTHAARYQLDAQRIAAWGIASGGHLAALLGTMSRRQARTDTGEVSADVQAVVDFGGPVDFLLLDEQSASRNEAQHNAPWSPESLLVGGPLQERLELVALTNPLTYLQSHRAPPPFLVLHGRNDPLVPLAQSELLVQALRRSGGHVEFRRDDDAGFSDLIAPEQLDLVTDFLRRRLRPDVESKARPEPDRVANRPWPRRYRAREIPGSRPPL